MGEMAKNPEGYDHVVLLFALLLHMLMMMMIIIIIPFRITMIIHRTLYLIAALRCFPFAQGFHKTFIPS